MSEYLPEKKKSRVFISILNPNKNEKPYRLGGYESKDLLQLYGQTVNGKGPFGNWMALA